MFWWLLWVPFSQAFVVTLWGTCKRIENMLCYFIQNFISLLQVSKGWWAQSVLGHTLLLLQAGIMLYPLDPGLRILFSQHIQCNCFIEHILHICFCIIFMLLLFILFLYILYYTCLLSLQILTLFWMKLNLRIWVSFKSALCLISWYPLPAFLLFIQVFIC